MALQQQAHDAQIMNEQLKHEMSQYADQLRQVAANNQQDMQRQLHEAQVTNAQLMATLHENAQRDMSERTKHQDDITALENRLIKTREEAAQQQAYLTQRFDALRSQPPQATPGKGHRRTPITTHAHTGRCVRYANRGNVHRMQPHTDCQNGHERQRQSNDQHMWKS